MYKTQCVRTTFGSWDVEKVHAVVARSTFGSQNVQNTVCSDHFWKLRCRKSAGRRGLPNVLRATTACTFSTSQLPKVVRTHCVLYILTSKCASHHDGLHFFDISTSKSGPNTLCFVHFDFQMCFAPRRPALFRHLNFQKWSEHGVFGTFWLRNVLRATTARNFSSLIWPAGSAPAALASLLFDPPEKNTVFRDFPTFSRAWIFFLLKNIYISRIDLLFDLLSSSLLFSFLLFSDSSHLCFSSVHFAGSLTSKLPSINSINKPWLSSCYPVLLIFDPLFGSARPSIGRIVPQSRPPEKIP